MPIMQARFHTFENYIYNYQVFSILMGYESVMSSLALKLLIERDVESARVMGP